MKQSELLRKRADMMDMAEKYGVDDWRKLVRLSNTDANGRYVNPHNSLHEHVYHKFALGVVEGKPVFEGEELYFKSGLKFTAHFEENGTIYGQFHDGSSISCHVIDCSWNPPKPKTVLVELPFDFVKANAELNMDALVLHEACRKALEGLKCNQQ